jgi:hypothetical protein
MVLERYVWMSPNEWTSLYTFTLMAMVQIAILYLNAMVNNTSLWHRYDVTEPGKSGKIKRYRFILPQHLLPPLVMTVIHSTLNFSLVVGVFLIWREGHRSEAIFSPPGPSHGTPGEKTYFLVNILFYIYYVLALAVPPIVFGLQALRFGAITQVLATLVLIGLTVFAYMVWWVPGLLITIYTVWSAYLSLMIILAWSSNVVLKTTGLYVPNFIKETWDVIFKHGPAIRRLGDSDEGGLVGFAAANYYGKHQQTAKAQTRSYGAAAAIWPPAAENAGVQQSVYSSATAQRMVATAKVATNDGTTVDLQF